MAKTKGESRGIKGLAVVPRWAWWLLAALAFALLATQAEVESSILPDHVATQCRAIDQNSKEQCSGYGAAVAFLTPLGFWLNKYGTAVSAIAAVAVAIFTGTLWVSTSGLWRATHEQFVAANAPAIGVFQIECAVAPDEPLKGSLFLINKGGTDARLIGTRVKHYLGERLPQRFPGEDGPPLILDEPIIRAGEAVHWSFPAELTLSQEEIGEIDAEKKHLFLLGIVRFEDNRGVLHRTIFCRQFSPKSMRWEPTNDYDYEITT